MDLAERCNVGMLPEEIEYSYNFVAVSAFRSTINLLLPVIFIDTELNKQFHDFFPLK